MTNSHIMWLKNGDHPDDHVGEPTVDLGKLCELRPELLDRDEPITAEDIPPEAYYTRIEGAVVRFFRVPDPEFAGPKLCDLCSRSYHYHGWRDTGGDGIMVCPGDLVPL